MGKHGAACGQMGIHLCVIVCMIAWEVYTYTFGISVIKICFSIRIYIKG